MTAPLNLGFLGGSVSSAIGPAHRAAAALDGKWLIAAGCFSRNPVVNRDTANEYGVAPARLHSDWRAMIAAECHALDAIAVLTPTPDHAAMVAACLDAGLPVICEKALATNSRDAATLRDLRQRRGGFLALTYNYSGYPMVRELRNIIRAGRLGRLIHFQVEMPQEGFVRTDLRGAPPVPQPWRLVDGTIPTIMLDLGVHLHHLLHYLTGARPERVVAQSGSHGWFADVVDDVSALIRYAGGFYGQAWFSKSAMGQRNGMRLRLYGTLGAAEWHHAEPEELRISHADGRREILDRAGATAVASLPRYARFKPGHPAGFIEAFGNLYADLATALRQWQMTGGFASDEIFGAELAVEGLALLEAMQRSATNACWETVKEAAHEYA